MSEWKPIQDLDVSDGFDYSFLVCLDSEVIVSLFREDGKLWHSWNGELFEHPESITHWQEHPRFPNSKEWDEYNDRWDVEFEEKLEAKEGVKG